MLAFRRVLERELPGLGCEVRSIAPPKRMLHVDRSSRWSKWLGYVDKFVLFIPMLAAHARWADVVHICDHSNSMYVQWLSGKPSLITCHDVIAIEASLGMIDGWDVSRTGRLFQRLIARGLARANLVACVSHSTQRALLNLQLADERRVATVVNCLNDNFSPVQPEDANLLIGRFGLSVHDRYLIHVGTDLARKNRTAVVETFIALQVRADSMAVAPPVQHLVLVGPDLAPETLALARQHGVADRIRTVQNVSHEELRALYASAVALLFPSLLEGFGWPVIEAQACGCPVFTSDLEPMNQIGGTGAVYIDPKDPVAIAKAIERAIPGLGEMRRLGLDNATRYTSAQMISNYVAMYRRLLAGHSDRAQKGH